MFYKLSFVTRTDFYRLLLAGNPMHNTIGLQYVRVTTFQHVHLCVTPIPVCPTHPWYDRSTLKTVCETDDVNLSLIPHHSHGAEVAGVKCGLCAHHTPLARHHLQCTNLNVHILCICVSNVYLLGQN